MKNSQMRSCIDYIRFTMEMEGSELSEVDEEIFLDVLDEKLTASDCIERYKEENKLDLNYVPSENESSFYPDTKCLINYYNIQDKDALKTVELFMANARTCELFLEEEPRNLTFSYLQELHGIIFGDVYPSAGVVRSDDASRRTEFCQPSNIDKMADEIFGKLARDNYLKDIEDRDDFINDLAFYMGELEALHPFKDGNGRTARFFFYKLIKAAGFDMAWNEADANRSLEANIAAIDGDYQPLIDVLEELLSVRD